MSAEFPFRIALAVALPPSAVLVYVTMAILMTSVTLFTANWSIGLSSLLVMALLVARTSNEEQMLVERFGQRYRDYMARTGRFCPRISLQ